MSNGRAHFFIQMGELAASHYRLTTGLSSTESDECVVEEMQFCRLVDAVFASPITLLYAWAQEASAIYEVIQGKRFHWLWKESAAPYFPFRPVHNMDLVPNIEEQATIGGA